jgi:hypothetical protein
MLSKDFGDLADLLQARGTMLAKALLLIMK